ncbi:MAG: hypothetical protein HPY59_03040 [Anaerolineae bacterium]|nr:hypothetical protein [Anaerolineae bacterium]
MILFKLLKVTGSSLEPEFKEGDFVGISGIPFLFHPPQTGDVIVFRKPPYGTMIKTIARVEPGQKEIEVWGTHKDSVDSRSFGPISFDSVIGKVIWRIHNRR